MKKWVIALSILFVASLIATVCFAVSLGTHAVVALFKDDGIVETWANRIEMFIDGRDYWIDDGFREVIDVQTVELPASASLSVLVDCGDVRLVCDSGSTVRATLTQTATRGSDKTEYSLTSENDETLWLKSTKKTNQAHRVKANLTVYVPAELAELYIETQLGNVELTDLQLDTLRATLDLGNLEMSNITAKQISAEVKLGEATLGRDVTASESLTVDCSCGNIAYCLPASMPFSLDYTVQTGNAEIDDSIADTHTLSSARRGVGCEGSIWYKTDSETVSTVTLKVGTGNVQIKTANGSFVVNANKD